jgi:hypothetical protein
MKRILLIITAFLIVLPAIPQAHFSDDAGIYSVVLEDLRRNLYRQAPKDAGGPDEPDPLADEWVHGESRMRDVVLNGRERRMFISWVRDHIHVLKAYKYWEKDLASYIEFFMERQSPLGMYYDYWESYRERPVGQLYFTNVFDRKFYYVDVGQEIFLFRMPMEADLEYLMVEGAYANWQATGDTSFLERSLPVLVRGMTYLMSHPLRWSDRHLLVKRPYTIDTWDFSSAPDGMTGVERLKYHIGNDENTPKGIMHGDNSGMYAASMQLSEMFSVMGNEAAAREWELQGKLFRERLNSLCWNGRFYSHFVTEDPIPSNINTDPVNSITLSNTYNMNRGAPTPEMTASILESYMELYEKTRHESVAEWYGIYPPIEPRFGNYEVGEYMNGAVLPLVGGELAKAALQNGYERYGIEQLKKLDMIMDMNGRRLPGCVNRDGTRQREAVPDEWGQAAFVSALVEGLAGVVDMDVLFRSVEISPRWYFAGVDETTVNVGYGGDGNHVNYSYRSDPSGGKVTLETSGRFETFTIRVPFPEGTSRVSVVNKGRRLSVETENINGSRYAVVQGQGSTNNLDFTFR